MKKFLVLYLAPLETMAEWMKRDPEERKEAKVKMQSEWKEWMQEHSSLLSETAGAGKTKLVSGNGVTDSKNDLLLYSLAHGDSVDEVAKQFEGHPHLGVPGATIEVMEANVLPSMKDF